MMTAVHVLIILSIGFLFSKKESNGWRLVFWASLLLKIAAGVGVGILYKFYYVEGGDTLWYFADGASLADIARTDLQTYLSFLWNGAEIEDLMFKDPRALFMSKVVSVFCLITQNNYWLSAAYFSLISFVCSWFVVKEIARMKPSLTTPAVIGFLFFPSVVFWTSGIIKESIAISCLYLLTMNVIRMWQKKRISIMSWLLILLAIWMLWNLKYYYLAVFLPVVTTLIVMQQWILHRLPSSIWIKTFSWCVVFAVPVFAASVIHPNFYPERFLYVIVENYQAFVKISALGDYVVFEQLAPTIQSVLYYSPKAFMAALFRPFLWEAETSLQYLIAFENSLLLIFLITAFRNVKRAFASPYRLLIFSAVIYISILAVFLALSTPNFGTLVRYRVGFLPFLVFLVLIDNPLLIFVTKIQNICRNRFDNS